MNFQSIRGPWLISFVSSFLLVDKTVKTLQKQKFHASENPECPGAIISLEIVQDSVEPVRENCFRGVRKSFVSTVCLVRARKSAASSHVDM